MDGFAVGRRLRAMPALEGVFIIAMSGHGLPRAEWISAIKGNKNIAIQSRIRQSADSPADV